MTLNSDWGLIGASAAIAWKPHEESTWELIAWRHPENIGKKREISSSIVKDMEIKHPETFVNRDPTQEKGLIAPRTPCPVLYGIRGSTSQAVLSAHEWLQSNKDVEKCQRFAIHRTNQLSDDHIRGFSTSTVLTNPKETKGAHSSLEVTFRGRSKTLVAFKEGGDVNRLLRKLIPGDRINWLGLESPDGSIHLERLRVESPVPRVTGRPICCNNKTMRSAGVNQPLRCIFCQRQIDKHWLFEDINLNNLELTNGWVEPSPSQRRHLSRPLSLGEPIRI
jgi:tRNA(Ile2)-agmatinylcytidine synthase